jgi:hypothetical protein
LPAYRFLSFTRWLLAAVAPSWKIPSSSGDSDARLSWLVFQINSNTFETLIFSRLAFSKR